MAKNIIKIEPIRTKRITVTIVGDSDLILNKMNDINARTLIDKQKNKQKKVEELERWEAYGLFRGRSQGCSEKQCTMPHDLRTEEVI